MGDAVAAAERLAAAAELQEAGSSWQEAASPGPRAVGHAKMYM